MNWKKFLGESLYKKIFECIGDKKISFSCFIRLAVEDFIERI